jgi:hypothetical protein
MLQKSADKGASNRAPFSLAPPQGVRMQYRNRNWRIADRERFISILTETGNPQLAADAIGQTLATAYRLRERWPQFADEWNGALAVAWEQVEMRVLSGLLDDNAAVFDAKVAMEMLKRRSPPPTRRVVTIDAAKMAMVRSEIRKLAAPD